MSDLSVREVAKGDGSDQYQKVAVTKGEAAIQILWAEHIMTLPNAFQNASLGRMTSGFLP
jgi:hypothetical protein